MNIDKIVEAALEETLREKGISNNKVTKNQTDAKQNVLQEAYVVEASKFNSTESAGAVKEALYQILFISRYVHASPFTFVAKPEASIVVVPPFEPSLVLW